MRTRLVAAGLGAIVLTGAATAAATLRNPLDYVLRPPDFPAKADPVDAGLLPASFQRKLRGLRVAARGARYFANIPFGPGRAETVSGLVVAAATSADAQRIYAWQKRTAMRLGKAAEPLSLPHLGDEQVARASHTTDTGRLLVRRGTIVWRIEIGREGTLALPPARLRDELAKYGAKQRQRVGAG